MNSLHRDSRTRAFAPWLLGSLLLAGACAARAQASVTPVATVSQVQTATADQRRTQATRPEIEALAGQEELGSASDRAHAQLLRSRLREGDFQVGDRIILQVTNYAALTDTFPVREGRVLRLPDIPDIPLTGILRSELQDYLSKRLATYLRNPAVRATSLVRVAVIGNVGKPGFYALPADLLVSDALMAAGGPQQNGDVNKIELRRGGKVVVDRAGMQRALASGITLDRLDVRPGDELMVPEKKTHDWVTILQASAAVLGVALGVIALQRNH